jgi:hypothetical protein
VRRIRPRSGGGAVRRRTSSCVRGGRQLEIIDTPVFERDDSLCLALPPALFDEERTGYFW